MAGLSSSSVTKAIFVGKTRSAQIHLTSTSQVIELVKKIHADRSKMEYVCLNYNKSRVEST